MNCCYTTYDYFFLIFFVFLDVLMIFFGFSVSLRVSLGALTACLDFSSGSLCTLKQRPKLPRATYTAVERGCAGSPPAADHYPRSDWRSSLFSCDYSLSLLYKSSVVGEGFDGEEEMK